jgi:hypothetical protein
MKIVFRDANTTKPGLEVLCGICERHVTDGLETARNALNHTSMNRGENRKRLNDFREKALGLVGQKSWI